MNASLIVSLMPSLKMTCTTTAYYMVPWATTAVKIVFAHRFIGKSHLKIGAFCAIARPAPTRAILKLILFCPMLDQAPTQAISKPAQPTPTRAFLKLTPLVPFAGSGTH